MYPISTGGQIGPSARPSAYFLAAGLLMVLAGCVAQPSGSKIAPDPATAADPGVFTRNMAEHLRQSLPGVTVAEQGPLTLNLKSPDGHEATANLDRLYKTCTEAAANCPAMTEQFTAASLEVLKTAAPATAAQLRLVVRSKADLDAAQAANGQASAPQAPIAQPLTGDLWQVLVLDFPNSLRYASQADLDSLHLTREAALAQALQNLTTSLTPLASVTHDLGPHQIGTIQGNAYDSSRILMAKDWAKMAQSLDGKLVVAVPSSDTVLYGEDNGVQSVRTLAVLAQAEATKAEHAVSPGLLRWTPTGWQSIAVP